MRVTACFWADAHAAARGSSRELLKGGIHCEPRLCLARGYLSLKSWPSLVSIIPAYILIVQTNPSNTQRLAESGRAAENVKRRPQPSQRKIQKEKRKRRYRTEGPTSALLVMTPSRNPSSLAAPSSRKATVAGQSVLQAASSPSDLETFLAPSYSPAPPLPLPFLITDTQCLRRPVSRMPRLAARHLVKQLTLAIVDDRLRPRRGVCGGFRRVAE